MEVQRSKEWFEKRKGLITGSSVGAILGVNPWRTPADVMRSMVREYHGAESEFKGNIATEYGTLKQLPISLIITRRCRLKCCVLTALSAIFISGRHSRQDLK